MVVVSAASALVVQFFLKQLLRLYSIQCLLDVLDEGLDLLVPFLVLLILQVTPNVYRIAILRLVAQILLIVVQVPAKDVALQFVLERATW